MKTVMCLLLPSAEDQTKKSDLSRARIKAKIWICLELLGHMRVIYMRVRRTNHYRNIFALALSVLWGWEWEEESLSRRLTSSRRIKWERRRRCVFIQTYSQLTWDGCFGSLPWNDFFNTLSRVIFYISKKSASRLICSAVHQCLKLGRATNVSRWSKLFA